MVVCQIEIDGTIMSLLTCQVGRSQVVYTNASCLTILVDCAVMCNKPGSWNKHDCNLLYIQGSLLKVY